MNALRISVLTAVVATLAAPLAGTAAPARDAAIASCATAPTSLVERRISEEAARGLPALIGFVNRTQPIYRLRVVDAVEWLDAEREQRTVCIGASADRAAG
jgi:hypothetical protein